MMQQAILPKGSTSLPLLFCTSLFSAIAHNGLSDQHHDEDSPTKPKGHGGNEVAVIKRILGVMQSTLCI